MPFGYHGKVLHVHLNDLKLEVETPSDNFYRKYFGGSALGLYYLLNNTPAKCDPLGEDNTLIFALSVLTGAPISGQSRMTAVAKSPLTNAVGDSQCGGFFPAEMKFAGYDAIVLHGRAHRPYYLWIHNGEVELLPAVHLWGKTTGEVDDLIKKHHGDERIQVLQAGIAGENLVKYAAIMNMANRANGRTGMGAVMASKNLKAVAVRGTLRPSVSDKKGLNKLARWGASEFPDSDVFSMGVLGTAEIVESQNKKGGFPSYNWESGTFEGWKPLDGKTMSNRILKERDTCYACVVRCKRIVQVTEGPYKVDPRYGGPEYETLSTFGAYCGIDNLEAVAYANQLCNSYGLDTISTGATIAWAMDCYENGLITIQDTDGLDLSFRNDEVMTRLVEMIATRQGFGDILAEGSARASEKIGRGTEDLVVAVKNQELPAHMPQVKHSLGLIYAVNPFGADHQSSEHDGSYADYPERMSEIGLNHPEAAKKLNMEKIEYALKTQYLYSALDTLNICQFVFGPAWHLYGPGQIVEMVNLITGWDISIEQVLESGERRLNLLRAFNAREGIGRTYDTVPKKLLKPLTGGASDGIALSAEEIESAKDIYYQMAGWDIETGIPTRQKLEQLDLMWAADLLES